MSPTYRRTVLITAAVHAVLILLLAIAAWIQGLFPKRPKEITTFVELRAPEPAPPAPPPEDPAPEPPPEPEPPPPAPEPPPPDPPPKKVERQDIEVSRTRVRREVTPPPAPPRPTVRPEDLARRLRRDIPAPRPATDDSVPDWYYAIIKRAMYEMWNQPSASSVRPGAMTRVSFRIARDGTVSMPQLVRSSGNAAMDASVMEAVRAVRKLKELPAQYAGDYKDVFVDFELAGM